MVQEWLLLKEDIERETERILYNEPEELFRLRNGQLGNRPGSYNQYFSTWDFANGMIRDYSMYTLYPLYRIAHDSDFEPAHLRKLFCAFDPPYSRYLEYSGLDILGSFTERFSKIMDLMVKKEFLDVLEALLKYTNRLAAWSFHYFPWRLGEQFSYKGVNQEKTMSTAIAKNVMGRKMKICWPELNISVTGVLADNLNRELCDDIWNALPLKGIQDHAVVTGKSMYAWVPIISVAPVNYRESICDSPIGRIRFSQNTGNKFIIQYGPTTETLLVPVLGCVTEEDIVKLSEVGEAVRQSTFFTKELIWIEIERIY